MQQNRSVCELSIDVSDIRAAVAMAVKRMTKAQGTLNVLHCTGKVTDKLVRDILMTAERSRIGAMVLMEALEQ